MLGFSAMNKVFVVIGNGKFELPFVYVDNLVDAIIKAIQDDKANNHVFNVIDSERINKKGYMNKLIKKLHPNAFIFYFPYRLLYFIIYAQEILCKLLKRPPFLTRYRLISSQKNISYDNSKITKQLNWKPKISIDEAFKMISNFEEKK
jgi:nucleoside-diphosphate-sugar epimerase